MPCNRIDRFGKLNEIQVNVPRFEKKDLVPLRVSKFPCEFIMYSSLLSEDGTHHYVLITDLEHSVSFIKNKQRRSRVEICRNCFHVCISLERLQNHKINFYKNETATFVLPDDKKELHQFKSTKVFWFVPLIFHFDTEALLVPIHTCASAANASG